MMDKMDKTRGARPTTLAVGVLSRHHLEDTHPEQVVDWGFRGFGESGGRR